MGELAFVALGTNLGDRDANLAAAREALAQLSGTTVVAATPVEETEPFGPPGQPPYLNQMVALDTTLEPHALLDALLAIAKRAGRERRERWGPRTLDLDIVRYGSRAISDARLTVPHPGLETRDFWQRELRQLDGSIDE